MADNLYSDMTNDFSKDNNVIDSMKAGVGLSTEIMQNHADLNVKRADVNLKRADEQYKVDENSRQNDMQPVNKANILSEIQERHTRAQLQQEEFEQKREEHRGLAFSAIMKRQMVFNGMSPEFQKTDRGHSIAQEIARGLSNLGMPHTEDDVYAAAKDDTYGSSLQAAYSLIQSGDPKDNAKAFDLARQAGIQPDELYSKVYEEQQKMLRTKQAGLDKIDANVALAGGQFQREQLKQNAETERKKMDVEARKQITGAKTIDERSKFIQGKVTQILEKHDNELKSIHQIQSLNAADPKMRTGVANVDLLNALIKFSANRVNISEYKNHKWAEGPLKGTLNAIKAAIGMADENGNVAFGKFLSPAMQKDIQYIGFLYEKDATRRITQELSPYQKAAEDLQERADGLGVKFNASTDVMGPEWWNKTHQARLATQFDPSTGMFKDIVQPKVAPDKPIKKGSAHVGGGDNFSKILSNYGISGGLATSLTNAVKRGATLAQINSAPELKGKPMSVRDYEMLKKRFGK